MIDERPENGGAAAPRNGASGGISHVAKSPAVNRGAGSVSQSRSTSPDAQKCSIDGGTLLETEQVLLRFAPKLLRYTAQIRREGRIQGDREWFQGGFLQYRILVPGEIVREIFRAMEEASALYEHLHAPLHRLFRVWKNLYDRCGEKQGV